MTADKASREPIVSLKWLYRILTFVVLPAAYLLLPRSISDKLILGWLLTTGLYVILLSSLGVANQPSKEKYRELFKPVVTVLGVIVWSGFLAVAYFFLYYILFDRENLFPK